MPAPSTDTVTRPRPSPSGWHTSGYSIYATDSYGSGNTWTVIAHNTGNSGNTESFTAFANCLKAF